MRWISPFPGLGERHGWFFPGLVGAPTIILLHGYESSRGELLTLVSALQDHQYNAFVFDFAAHGSNAGITTFGYRESDEVRAAIDTLAKRTDVDPARFGVWGYNLGAYAGLREAEKDPRVRAMVLDSIYDYPKQMVKIGVEKTGVGGFPMMVKSAQTCFEWLNYAYKDDLPVSARLKAMAGVPTLYIQAADDPELASITRQIFLKAPEPKESAIIAHGNFVNLADEEKRDYENRVVSFFLARLPVAQAVPAPRHQGSWQTCSVKRERGTESPRARRQSSHTEIPSLSLRCVCPSERTAKWDLARLASIREFPHVCNN